MRCSSPGRLGQDDLVEREIRDGSPEPGIPRLDLFEALHLIELEPAELATPAVIRGRRDANRASTVCPCETSTSTWRSFATISSGV